MIEISKLTWDELPESIPTDIRECFISIVQLINEGKSATQSNTNTIRVNHMIQTSYIAESICKKIKSINQQDLTICTVSALFHDIFKLLEPNDISMVVNKLPSEYINIDDKNMIKKNHAMLGSKLVEVLFKRNNNFGLDDNTVMRIYDCILVHSDKEDKDYVKTEVQQIVIDSDLLEKIGPTSVYKIFDSKLNGDYSKLDAYILIEAGKFVQYSAQLKMVESIELYKHRIQYFNNFVSFMNIGDEGRNNL